MSDGAGDRAESIRRRIRDRLRERGEDVQFGLQRYATERFLFRLGDSPHRDRFVLKGATLFALWSGTAYRPTRDIDFAGYGSAAVEDVLDAIRDICRHPTTGDVIVFAPDTLAAEPIRDESEYNGLRIRLEAMLGKSRIPVRIDIGFGDAVEPPSQDSEYPTLLDDPPPLIRTYPPEAVVAEKLHAMVILGGRNSRYKDFYDMHVLARRFKFDGELLKRAIAATFERRRTSFDGELPAALQPGFYGDAARAAQWRAYLTRSALSGVPAEFEASGELLQRFLVPLWHALADGRAFSDSWPPAGPWTPRKD